MSKETIFIACVEGLLTNFEKRLELVEKAIGKNFHGNSGYTKGCRCKICTNARKESVAAWRKENRKNAKAFNDL